MQETRSHESLASAWWGVYDWIDLPLGRFDHDVPQSNVRYEGQQEQPFKCGGGGVQGDVQAVELG